MKELVAFKNVKLGYGGTTVFGKLNFSIYQGDFIGIVGPNGSGKTTILRSIMGLLKPQSGKIERSGSLRFGYCKQRQFVDTLFPFTVREIVMMGRTGLIGCFKRPSHLDKKKVREALETVKIPELISERFYDLSGGQKQRVLIARALAVEPQFLILDEPTTDLDVKAEREILGLIKELHQKKNITVALVSHEFNEFVNLAEKFIFLKEKDSSRVYNLDELNEELLSDIFNTDIKLREIDGHKYIL